MSQIWMLLILKIASLVGSIASSVGFVGIFAYKETLGPYVWHLIVGGFALIAAAEGAAYVLAKRMGQGDENDGQDS